MSILTVDPGMNTAFVVWKNNILSETGIIKVSNKKDLTQEEKLVSLWSQFDIIVRRRGITKCYIEGVEVWMGSDKSIVSASTGKLMLLSYLIGSYCHICYEREIEFQIIKPTEWKGQMTKKVTKLRVERALETTFSNSHVIDAVGIGLSVQGRL